MILSLVQDIFKISLDSLLGKQGSYKKLFESCSRTQQQDEVSPVAKDGVSTSQEGSYLKWIILHQVYEKL